jgi:regulator of protease activity HflC (stomatin/prohibitin superfamily)
MKWKQIPTLLLCFEYIGASNSQDINLTNRVTSFTNLQGQAFTDVQLVRGDLDGVIWRKESGGGRVCYTNLSPMLLEAWGIPTNRIEIARARVERRASSSAQEKAWALKQAQQDTAARAKADAEEAAMAPRKAKAEQMAADAQAIANLEQQIRDAKARMRRAKAVAHDYNKANLYNDYAPTLYVRESEKVKIAEAEDWLKKMKADFALKYKER